MYNPLVQSSNIGAYVTEVVFPQGITSLPNSALSYCTGLKEITIPATVQTIGQNAFLACDNLVTVKIERSSSLGVIQLGSYPFSGCYKLASIEVPNSASVLDYGAAANWSNFKTLIKVK